jgi:dephospho-CoA kinase
MILGLTGSVGSGKSTVSAMLSERGAFVICADQVVREVVVPGSKVLQEIASEFGHGLVLEDGSLDRKGLAAIVFPDPARRKRLEAIVHPPVRAMVLNLLDQNRAHPLVVLDVPLLFESGYERWCDHTISVTVSEAIRQERLAKNRGMTPAETQARVESQLPQEEKNQRASFLIDNSGDVAQTCKQVVALLDRLFPGELPPPLRRVPCAPQA